MCQLRVHVLLHLASVAWLQLQQHMHAHRQM